MEHYQQLRIERKPETLQRTGFSRTTLYTRVKQQLFVPPISLGERCVGFVSSEVDSVLAAMIAGQSKDEIKALVASLVEQRKNAVEVTHG